MTQSVLRTPRRLALVLGLLVTAACTGENLFSLATSASALGPTLEITAPTAGFTIALGDSILITATANAPSGAASVAYKGEYQATTAAFVPETETLGGADTAPAIRNYLQAGAGQVTGAAWIIVTLTDGIGATVTDSVNITITN